MIVAGNRTPFVRSFGDLIDVDTVALGVSAVEGLLKKTKLNPDLLDEIIWGCVGVCISSLISSLLKFIE